MIGKAIAGANFLTLSKLLDGLPGIIESLRPSQKLVIEHRTGQDERWMVVIVADGDCYLSANEMAKALGV